MASPEADRIKKSQCFFCNFGTLSGAILIDLKMAPIRNVEKAGVEDDDGIFDYTQELLQSIDSCGCCL